VIILRITATIVTFGFFPAAFEAVMERLEPRIPITGTHRRHIEHLADVRTTAPDAPPSLERTALESIGSDADQRSDLLTGHAAELGQEHNQRAGQDRSNPGHGREQSVSMRERGIGRNDLDQTPIEQLNVGGEPADTSARKTLQHRVFQQSRGILSGDFLGTELAANSEHLGQQFGMHK
jgi:hypothetical protein